MNGSAGIVVRVNIMRYRIYVALSGLLHSPALNPGLTPWAILCRRFAALIP